ncbi:hypothetical protein C8R44DRAFT_892958 [Mycena epipterygia]|nr:hypothetical protein C8R44DRAFT_892958 [Mycena epipterygia]
MSSADATMTSVQLGDDLLAPPKPFDFATVEGTEYSGPLPAVNKMDVDTSTPEGEKIDWSNLDDDNAESMVKFEPTPLRGGGVVSVHNEEMNSRTATPKKVRAMALTGSGADLESALLQRIEGTKWFLNENIGAPQCHGNEIPTVDNEGETTGCNPECAACHHYFAHVSTDFGANDGSIKAVLELRDLYAVAETRLDVDRLRKEVESVRIQVGIHKELETRAREETTTVTTELVKLRADLAACKVAANGDASRVRTLEGTLDNYEARLTRGEHQYDTVCDDNRELRMRNEELLAQLEREPQRKRSRHAYTSEDASVDLHISQEQDAPMADAPFGDNHITAPNRLQNHEGPISTFGLNAAEVQQLRDERTAQLPRPVVQNGRQYGEPIFKKIGYAIPPRPEKHLNDKDGVPLDQYTWERTFLLSQEEHYWVYGLRHFAFWIFAQAIPEEQRLIAHTLAIKHYVLTDWMANTLSAIAQQSATNRELVVFYENLSRAKLQYNPMIFAGYIQFRQLLILGVRFYDDVHTVNLREIRGANLLEVLSTPYKKPRSANEEERKARNHIDKLIITIFVTAGLYAERTHALGDQIADKMEPRSWPVNGALDATIDSVIECMNTFGISIAAVDDAWVFGRNVLQDVVDGGSDTAGWTVVEAAALLQSTDTSTPPPPSSPVETELWPRDPTLPFKSKWERAAQYSFSDWKHPALAGLKREQGSKIQKLIDEGKSRRAVPNFDREWFLRINPWLTPNSSESIAPTFPPTSVTSKGKERAAIVKIPTMATASRSSAPHPALRHGTSNRAGNAIPPPSPSFRAASSSILLPPNYSSSQPSVSRVYPSRPPRTQPTQSSSAHTAGTIRNVNHFRNKPIPQEYGRIDDAGPIDEAGAVLEYGDDPNPDIAMF